MREWRGNQGCDFHPVAQRSIDNGEGLVQGAHNVVEQFRQLSKGSELNRPRLQRKSTGLASGFRFL